MNRYFVGLFAVASISANYLLAQTVDFVVESVDFLPDVKVEIVDFFPDEKWEVVGACSNLPNLRVDFVDFLPDVKVEIVDFFADRKVCIASAENLDADLLKKLKLID